MKEVPSRRSLPGAAVKPKYRPAIRTILLLVSLMVLLLPLGSLVFFRIYENQLVRETEGELIAQSAVIAALYRKAVRQALPDSEAFGSPLEAAPADEDEPYAPIAPAIDLQVETVLPRRPDGRPAPPASVELRRIGRDMTDVVLMAQRTTLAGFRLLDHRGVVIGGRDELGLSFAQVAEVRRARAGGRYVSVLRHRTLNTPTPPLASISRGTGVRIFTVYPVIEAGRLWGFVYMSRTPNNILKHMYASRGQFLLIGLGIILLTLLLTWITSRTIGSPVNALAAQARRLARGDRDAIAPLNHYGTREVADLGQSFVDMAKAVETRSNYLREFAAHVSHEFKTPLTGIRGAAELLSEHADRMEPAERRKFAENIAADAERLHMLVDRLLEMARADNLEPGRDSVVLAPALGDIANALTVEGFSVEVDGSGAGVAAMSQDSLAIVLRNLAANAHQHGASRISISVTPEDAAFRLRLQDNGRGISAGNQPRIFEPFFTTRRENGGTGLGLRIVAAVIEAHGGRIALAPSEGKGAAFDIWIPKAA